MSSSLRLHLRDAALPPCAVLAEAPGYRVGHRFDGVLEYVDIVAAETRPDLPPGVPELVGADVLPPGSVLLGFSVPLGANSNDLWCDEFAEYVVRVLCALRVWREGSSVYLW